MPKKILTALLLATIVTAPNAVSAKESSQSDEIWDELISMSLEDLENINVVTASKRTQRVEDAPSPIYIFTAEDIKRTGVRSIMELVKFIPGFYIYPRLDQTFVIANRGLRSSSNDKILFLVDGIPINNIAQGGAVNAHIFPGLEKVKRVEIISGPGSTMWGSDASAGIISVITKDGKDIDGTNLSINLASEDNHKEFNFLSGENFSNGEYLLSFTFARNDGFGDERNGYNNYVHDFETVPWNDDNANFNHIYPSYEFFGKVSINNFTLKALASEKNIYSFWTTTQSTTWRDKQDKASIISSKDMHLELSHHKEISVNKTLDTKFTAKQIEYVRNELVDVGSNHGSDYDDPTKELIDYTSRFPENGFGLELIFNWDIHEKHKLLAGSRIRVINAGPARIDYVNLDTGKTPNDTTVRDSIYYQKTTDTTYGAYFDYSFFANSKLTFIGGLRLDYNTPREEVYILSPRGSMIYKFTDQLTAKYMYNTGYVRPTMSKSFEVALSKSGSVRESEKILAHDITLMYNTHQTQLSAGLFAMKIHDRNRYDALAGAFVDTGDVMSSGAELSLKRSFLNKRFMLDMNYGYATAKTKDRFGNIETYYEGIPDHVYAIGLNYQHNNYISFYANVNGWRNLKMDSTTATSWIDSEPHPDYSGEHLVDLNLRFENLLNNSIDLSLYVLNALDRKARLQAKDDWHAWWSYARGRSIGLKTSLKF